MERREARDGTVILGGGFAGSYVARLLRGRGATIVSPENYMLYTQLLPEAGAGTLEPRHVVVPLRQMCPHAELLLGHVTNPVEERRARAGCSSTPRRRSSRRSPEGSASMRHGTSRSRVSRSTHGRRSSPTTGARRACPTAPSSPRGTLVWTAGVRAHPLLAELGLPLDDRGGADATLRVEGLESVWALGDCTAVPNTKTPGAHDPPTCQHALRQARRLAKNLNGSAKPYG